MYQKILVPIDGSDTSTAGLNEALGLAKIHGAQLYLLHIVNELVLDYTWALGTYSGDFFQTLRQGGKEILDTAERAAVAQGIRPARILLESIGAVAADLILEEAQKLNAGLIVMGTHGRRGIFRLAMGGDAEQVVRGARTPVMLIRGQARALNFPGTVGEVAPTRPRPAASVCQ
jgi:nucleotide-binding universal stress UspA family protein